MPELPEVETVVRTLNNQIIGRKIIFSTLLYPRVIQSPALGLEELNFHEFTSITRKGKFIIFNLNDDLHMLLHLRMEGKIFYLDELPEIKKAVSFYLTLDKGFLVFQDTRKFGVSYIYKGESFYNEEPLNKVGLDPFLIDEDTLFNLYKNQKGYLKETLLNQSLMSGIGNIYADEVLFASNLSPFMSPTLLTKENIRSILLNSRKILLKSIELGGSTVKSYQSSLNHAGSYQNEIKVYGNVGMPCPICKTKLEKRSLDGRGTTFCRRCQNVGLTIGITGLIGTGKSTLTKLFVDKGFLLYDCDKKVEEFYENKSYILEVTKHFAPIFDKGFSKEVLLNIMLQDNSFRRKYENFIYQKINQDLCSFLNANSTKNIVVEAPRLFEAHLEKYFSFIIAVTADEEVIKERLINRGAKNIEKLLILNKKSLIIKKMSEVDFVIQNNSSQTEFVEEGKKLIEKICSL